MLTSSKKNKGRNHQKMVRDKILKTLQLEKDDVRSTSMGASGVDILLSPLAQKKFPWAIECKSVAKIAAYSFYEQAVANSTEKLKPLVVMKANGKQPMVMLSFDHFMELYENQ